MANALFDDYRNNMLGDNTYTNVQLDADTIKTFFVDHGVDTPVVTDRYVNPGITAGAQVPAYASAATILTKTIGTLGVGVFDAVDTTHTSLSGASAESMVLFKDSGADTTSPLLVFFDAGGFASGMPLSPNGGNVTVQWNASGIFSL